MGIDKNRFTFSNIENFICGICNNVAMDPVLIVDCEHYICRACVPAYMERCPTCGSEFVGCKEIGPALKRVYLNIKLRCCYISCQEELTIENFELHERSCQKGVYQCQHSCGFKVHVTFKDEIYRHNCINYLVGENEHLNDKVNQLERANKGLQMEKIELNKKVELLEANNDLLQTSVNTKRARCAIMLRKGDKFYRCFTCQLRRISVMCVDCFEGGNHNNHKYSLVESDNDRNYCDCGDMLTLDKGSTCVRHQV